MKVESVFGENEKIQVRHTCDGADVSPWLKISEIPSKSKTLVLIVDDPDAPAGVWVHWVVFNIFVSNASGIEIKEGAKPGTDGKNDFGRLGWGGPCPPSGSHRYFFKVYALNSELDLEEGASKQDVEQAMKDKIVDNAELVGIYSRG